MRVLFLARTLTVGGIEPHMATLGSGLMNSGWSVAIASDGGRPDDPHGVAWFSARGFPHYPVSFPSPGDPPASVGLSALRAAAGLQSAISAFRPDLIHVHYRATSAYARLAQASRGIPFVTTLHVIPIPAGPLHRTASFWGDRTIAISRDVQDFLIQAFRVNPDRIRMIPNGVDETYYRPPTPHEHCVARRKFSLRCGAPVIALVGRMSQPKGHDVLLRALATLRNRGSRVDALFAGVSIEGDTLWRDGMIKLAHELGVSDQVHFLGFTETRDVLWASDVLVLPSRAEGFPLSIIEAMLAKVVPVRTPAAGAAEQIDEGENGFVVPFDDSDALADRIERLVYNPELRRAMAVKAREKALANFSAQAMVAKTIRVYEEVLK